MLLHYIALHCIALHCIALHCIALHCIALHCIALHYITLHYITLHYITLHYITLHYITLLFCVKPLGVTQFVSHQVERSDIQRHACDICKLQYTVGSFFLQLQSLLRHPLVHQHDLISEHAFGMGGRERSRGTSWVLHLADI